jgi:MarR family 2-MHQ and catechol resistance regulon transcriptional repressor
MNKLESLSTRISTWLALTQLHVSVSQYEDKECAKMGISIPQFYILAAIKYLPSPVTTTDIARWVDRKVNTVALVLDQMEKKGLVTRERNLPDRRQMRLTITPKSELLFSKATTPIREIPNDMLSCLSNEELQQLSDILYKIRKRAYTVLNLRQELSELHDHRIETMTNLLREHKDRNKEPAKRKI